MEMFSTRRFNGCVSVLQQVPYIIIIQHYQQSYGPTIILNGRPLTFNSPTPSLTSSNGQARPSSREPIKNPEHSADTTGAA